MHIFSLDKIKLYSRIMNSRRIPFKRQAILLKMIYIIPETSKTKTKIDQTVLPKLHTHVVLTYFYFILRILASFFQNLCFFFVFVTFRQTIIYLNILIINSNFLVHACKKNTVLINQS